MRLAPEMNPENETPIPLPSWSRWVGSVSGVMGLLSIGWAFYGRSEFGDLVARLSYFQNAFDHDRVSDVVSKRFEVSFRCFSRLSSMWDYFQSSNVCY